MHNPKGPRLRNDSRGCHGVECVGGEVWGFISMTIEVFVFNGRKVRTAGTSESPLFCAADVCSILGIENVGNAVARLRDLEKASIRNADEGKNAAKKGPPRPPMIYVTEPGLYKLVFSSRKSEAEAFQDWVTGEVLPEIRKRGVYSLAEALARKELVEQCFRALPEKQATLFEPLIDALRRLARNSSGGTGGTPPWARLIACWIYEWTWKQHKKELRRRNPKQDDGTLIWRDYDALTEEGRRLVTITIGMACFAAHESTSWQQWREKMETHFTGQNYLPFPSPPKQLNGRRRRAA